MPDDQRKLQAQPASHPSDVACQRQVRRMPAFVVQQLLLPAKLSLHEVHLGRCAKHHAKSNGSAKFARSFRALVLKIAPVAEVLPPFAPASCTWAACSGFNRQ